MGGINSINYACYREVNNRHMLAVRDRLKIVLAYFKIKFSQGVAKRVKTIEGV
jgi:hypothetical protein